MKRDKSLASRTRSHTAPPAPVSIEPPSQVRPISGPEARFKELHRSPQPEPSVKSVQMKSKSKRNSFEIGTQLAPDCQQFTTK
ncbi:hypothetical protein JYU34_017542, partial [Plutella xylostella]